MSEAMTASMSRATFALQSRLFVAMKRAGRVIDLVWFQHNPEYAGAVLDTAARMSDDEVHDIGQRLRELVGPYLAQAAPAQRPAAAPAAAVSVPAPEAAPASVAPAPAATLDRHMTSLR